MLSSAVVRQSPDGEHCISLIAREWVTTVSKFKLSTMLIFWMPFTPPGVDLLATIMSYPGLNAITRHMFAYASC